MLLATRMGNNSPPVHHLHYHHHLSTATISTITTSPSAITMSTGHPKGKQPKTAQGRRSRMRYGIKCTSTSLRYDPLQFLRIFYINLKITVVPSQSIHCAIMDTGSKHSHILLKTVPVDICNSFTCHSYPMALQLPQTMSP